MENSNVQRMNRIELILSGIAVCVKGFVGFLIQMDSEPDLLDTSFHLDRKRKANVE
jgi:hypothetical protein